jgi:hypothetical protein
MGYKKLPYQAFNLYRRGPLLIKEEFNGTDNLEQSLNEEVLLMQMNTFPDLHGGTGIHSFTPMQNTDFNGAPYYSAYADKSSSLSLKMQDWRIPIICDGKEPSFFEFKFDAGVFGPGLLTSYVTDELNIDQNYLPIDRPQNLVERFYGPCSWQISDYHMCTKDQWIQFVYATGGKTDPGPRCEIDNIVYYPYYPIDCEFAKLTPAKTDTSPKKLSIIRGYNAFQTTNRLNTIIDVVLRFYSYEAHSDFLINADQPHIVCDEKGVPYRCVAQLGEAETFGSGVYEQKVTFMSNCKLGVGWR